MQSGPGNDGGRPGRAPPFGTSQRIRNRAIWAVALFAAAMPPAFVGLGDAARSTDLLEVALMLALAFWAIGLLFALWTAFPTLRYWEGLPVQTRWLGALPLLSVSLFLSTALIVALFV
ncbi:MAG TPA: hypothetical protein VEP47_18870 [Reyranella sp.]|nr:hypothetical protein [Reyranella sp.]